MSQNTSSEKDLGLSNSVEVSVKFQCCNHVFTSFFAIHEPFWNNIGCEEFISLSELLERDSVGETLSANSDSFQDTIATELVKDESSVDLTGFLLVIGNDTTDEVGIGVSQRDLKIEIENEIRYLENDINKKSSSLKVS